MPERNPLRLTPEVDAALREGRPMVALESTIITHGMPYPANAETARAVEQAVRDAGATPATIAVVGGEVLVGLDTAMLDRIGRDGHSAMKASRRDLPVALARGGIAGTTVAATMFIAARAGIRVFATGGIGGVHRGAEGSFDVSADLLELGQSPVCVVCAGAKSILDIPKTLEVLETQGVLVVGYRTDHFPAFYARSSGEPVDHRCDSAAEIAMLITAQRRLGLLGGLLVGNPIPPEHALDAAEIEVTIARAVAEAAECGITRKALTPFLLGRIVELTQGGSLAANIALVRHNAQLAASIAVELARLA